MAPEKLRIGARLAAGFGAVLIILLAIAWLGLSRMTLLEKNQNLVHDRLKMTQEAEKSLAASAANMILATHILVAKDKSEIEPLIREQNANLEIISDAVRALMQNVHDGKEKELLAIVERTRQDYILAFIENRQIVEQGDRKGAMELANRKLIPARTVNLKAWNDFVQLENDHMEQAIEESNAAYASGIALLLKMAIFALLAAWLTAYLLMRSITVPMGVMAAHLEEHRKLLDVLRESQQRLRLHIEQTPLIAIEWNLNSEVTDWNPAAEKVFGYTRAEALGRQMSFIVPENIRPQIEQIFRELLTGTLREPPRRKLHPPGAPEHGSIQPPPKINPGPSDARKTGLRSAAGRAACAVKIACSAAAVVLEPRLPLARASGGNFSAATPNCRARISTRRGLGWCVANPSASSSACPLRRATSRKTLSMRETAARESASPSNCTSSA
ncbi:MAG: PAS domain S-box protein [Acidobacteriia bacterium]|nr:PAS domain S-box protein [Terriglobia bacterium]